MRVACESGELRTATLGSSRRRCLTLGTAGLLSSLGGCLAGPPPNPAPRAVALAPPYVVLIGGLDSDPTPRQIAGTARRGEGHSGPFQLMQDFRRAGIAADFFNWNGTRAGNMQQSQPPLAPGITAHIRAQFRARPNQRLILLGNSWGGHTAWLVTQLLAEAPAIPIEHIVFLDPSSFGRGEKPRKLPAHVQRAVVYYTHNFYGWKGLPADRRVRNVDLSVPANGFATASGPRSRYRAAFDMQAHIAAEWDPKIHAEVLALAGVNVAQPGGPR